MQKPGYFPKGLTAGQDRAASFTQKGFAHHYIEPWT